MKESLYVPAPGMNSPCGLAPQLSSPPTPICTASMLTVSSSASESSHWWALPSSIVCGYGHTLKPNGALTAVTVTPPTVMERQSMR